MSFHDFNKLGPFVVAEISGNHNGSIETALKIMEEVAVAGAHAVKLQTYTPETITLRVDSPDFRVSSNHSLWGGQTLFDLYSKAFTPWEWHHELFQRGKDLGLTVFSTPFDESAVDFLEKLGVPIYKIASMEIVDIPLITYAASTSKPLIISTGAASLGEIEKAVCAARRGGCTDLTLLLCSSSYPANPENINLSRLSLLQELFNVRVGYSDHTQGSYVALAAVALGAQVIEKHVKLNEIDNGVDSAFSADPIEFCEIVTGTKHIYKSLGLKSIWQTSDELESLRLRPSLRITKNVRKGEVLDIHNVKSVRPSGGLLPENIDKVLGMRFKKDFKIGDALDWNMIEN